MPEQLTVDECDVCHQTDSDPRHRFYNPAMGDVQRHMDCCASVGCSSCAGQIAGANGVKGAELRSHLETPKES